MKIVVSGGWGYGNFGDDAILNATIGVLRRRFPGCRIVVLTYDLADSFVHQVAGVELEPCAHALVDMSSSEVLRPRIGRNYSFLLRKLMDLHFKLTETGWWFRVASRLRDLRRVDAAIDGADLFVMGGGGYLNEKWLCKTRAQLYELRAAHQRSIPVAVLGPTIGNFAGGLEREIAQQLGRASVFTVRDAYSFDYAKTIHANVHVVPDVALSAWLEHSTREVLPELGIVFNNQGFELCNQLAAGVKRFLASRPEWRVRLFVSRQWKYDVAAAQRLQRAMHTIGVASDVVLASDYRSLEKSMAGCQLVVSENLHGLILAARNLVPVVAINDYPLGSPNYKKFMAFLSQSKAEQLSINVKTSPEQIFALLDLAYAQREERRQVLSNLREQVRLAYAGIL